jgi:hypothetical protein
MMRLLESLAHVPEIQEIYSRGGTVQAFFDDVGVGTDTLEDHERLLHFLFQACAKLSLRIKLTKCEFAVEEIEYLGFELSFNRWRPSKSKVAALQNVQIRNLKDLRSFLGALNFFRRHIKNFTYSSSLLSDLTKKNAIWRWGEEEEKAVAELKRKVKEAVPLGVPRSHGEMVIITDAYDAGGGATIRQWQSGVDFGRSCCPDPCSTLETSTLSVFPDGSLSHTHPTSEHLVLLGSYNWKWSPTRSRYSTYEKELLAGVLVLGSQKRILSHLPVVWLCDQKAVKEFYKNDPPENARQRRWWLFLTQFRLSIAHIPGCKNELPDFLSREAFDMKYSLKIDELARAAFSKMDMQLDLRLECLPEDFPYPSPRDYEEDQNFSVVWNSLRSHDSNFSEHDGKMYYKSSDTLLCEGNVPYHFLASPGLFRDFTQFLLTPLRIKLCIYS